MPVFARDLETTLQRALSVAGERGAEVATQVHLALALAENVFIGELMQACAVDPESFRTRLRLLAGPVLDNQQSRKPKPDDAFEQTIQRAVVTAQAARRDLGPSQMFLALLDEADDPLSTALKESGVARYDVIRYISHGVRKNRPDDEAASFVDSSTSFAVKLLNDDYTPMEFVVSVLRDEFGKTDGEAVRLMLEIHQRGSASCGTYPHEVAAAKMTKIMGLAREHQHPLHCVLEQQEV